MAAGFCALCLASIADVQRWEPLGRNDGLVAVCDGCALEIVVPKEKITARSMQLTDLDPTALRIKLHRDDLYREGLCTNGRKHGPRVAEKRLCQACIDGRTKKSARP